MSALAPLVAAVFGRLSADAGLAAYTNPAGQAAAWRVFDRVPEGTSGPYVKIAEKTEVEGTRRLGRNRGSWDDTVTLHLWSEYDESDREVLEGLRLVDEALLGEALTVDGYGTVILRRETGFTVPVADTDQGWRHLSARYRARVIGTA